jgi:tetratricopeptide (TPR) repeat protein
MNKDDLKKYLEEGLSEKEKNAIERELSDDPFFADSVEGLQDWKKDTGKDITSLENELETRVDNIPAKKNIFRMPVFRMLLVAACLFVICFLALDHLFEKRQTTEQLFATYFKPLTHPDMIVRGEEDLTEKKESMAVRSYEAENYKQAIFYYKQLLETQPENEKHKLFLGIAFLANHQPEQAIEILNRSFTQETRYENDRNWYLALSYLRLNNLDAARPILEQLSSASSYYTEPAAELLKAIN